MFLTFKIEMSITRNVHFSLLKE